MSEKIENNIDKEEIKVLIKECLSKHKYRYRAWSLANKYDLEQFYNAQCKRYSLDPEYIKIKRFGGYAAEKQSPETIKFNERLYFYLKKEIDLERRKALVEHSKNVSDLFSWKN